jgi:hypothetical protein
MKESLLAGSMGVGTGLSWSAWPRSSLGFPRLYLDASSHPLFAFFGGGGKSLKLTVLR